MLVVLDNKCPDMPNSITNKVKLTHSKKDFNIVIKYFLQQLTTSPTPTPSRIADNYINTTSELEENESDTMTTTRLLNNIAGPLQHYLRLNKSDTATFHDVHNTIILYSQGVAFDTTGWLMDT
eukprot:267713-Amphidinium_carterae.1